MEEMKFIGPCKICKVYLPLSATDKWVYHKSVGVICTKHHGVEGWYNELFAGRAKRISADCGNEH